MLHFQRNPECKPAQVSHCGTTSGSKVAKLLHVSRIHHCAITEVSCLTRKSDCKIMEVLRFIKVYRCKASELPRFAWMQSAVSIKCSMFFCGDSRMRSCQRARFWFDYINTLFEPFCLKCAALNLVPGRDAAAQKHMTGLRVLSIPASAPPWDTQKRDRSTASIDLAYDCIWALLVICCFGSSGWPRSGGPTKIIWHVCVFWVF